MKKDLIIIGAGCVGGHVACSLEDYTSEYNLIGFLDDCLSKNGCNFVGFPVLGNVDSIINYPKTTPIVIGIAFPFIKFKIVEKLKALGYTNFPSLVSNATWLSKNVKIGEGCILYPGTAINYNGTIGNFVVLNMICAVGHDCIIEDYVSFAPGVLLGGNTTIGRLTQMGVGSQTLQKINVGQKAIVGAAAVIIENVEDTAVVVGNPGRVIKYNA